MATKTKAKTTKTMKATTTKKPAAKTKPAAKPVAKTTSKPATVKKTTQTTTKTTKAKQSVKKQKHCFAILLWIIIAVLVLGIGALVVVKIIDANTADIVLEDGEGKEVPAKYISFKGYDYSVVVPQEFKKMSHDDIVSTYGETDAPAVVYTNSDKTASLALSEPSNAVKNEEIEEYLEAMKAIYTLSADVVNTETRKVGDNTVGIIRLVTTFTDEKLYNVIAFFEDDGKLAIIAFNCHDSERSTWSPIAEGIINSLKIEK